MAGEGLGDLGGGADGPERFRVGEERAQDAPVARLVDPRQVEVVDLLDRDVEVGADDEALEVADDQQGRVEQGLAVAEELLVGLVEVLALALVFPGEAILPPDVGEATLALGRLAAIAVAWNAGPLGARAHVDRSRGARADYAAVFRQNARDEALPFPNALHLNGNGVHGLVEPVEAVGKLLWKRAYRSGASFPDASGERNGNRKKHRDDEHPGQHEDFFWRARAHVRRPLDDGTGCGCRIGHRQVGSGELLVHVRDAFVELADSQLQSTPQ